MPAPQVVVALLTPFAADGQVDTDALGAHLDLLVDAGVDGVMPCGTTGEGPLLSSDEIERMTDATVAAARGRLSVFAHVGRMDTASTVALAEQLATRGVAALSAVVPSYYSYSDAQLLGHYRALISAAGTTPVYAYTIPARTGNELSTDVVKALAEDGLRGVKDSTKSIERHLEYLACGVEVLIGTDGLVREAFQAGAAGCVSALANVRPDLLVALRDGHDDAEQELLELRSRLPMQRLKSEVAKLIPGYPTAYRAPLG